MIYCGFSTEIKKYSNKQMQTYATKKYLILIKRAKKQQVKENK